MRPLAAATDPQLTGLVGWIADLVATLGPVGVGVAVALETIVPPIPSEAVLPLAGFLAGRGEMSLWAAIGWATVGSLVGAWGAYAAGRALGEERIQAAWSRIPLSEDDDLERANRWFADHAEVAVLVGRCVPVVRSLVSVPAGVAHMPLGRFTLLTAVGSGVWNAAFVLLGHALGSRWRSVGAYSDWLNLAVLVATAVGLALAVRKRVRRRSTP